MRRFPSSGVVIALVIVLGPPRAPADQPRQESSATGTVPADAQGLPLNLDFETGTLADWTTGGTAFGGQPIEGDSVIGRRGDMRSGHAGRFWVGTYERAGDAPTGTLTSLPFRISKPFASFLVGGGSHATTRVELLRKDTGEVVFRASGDDREDLERVVVDLSQQVGQEIVIRLVDGESGGWGHINFDSFRLHDVRPCRRGGALGRSTSTRTPGLVPRRRHGR
jgi:hypothetical protein